jgi:hypothetical protein
MHLALALVPCITAFNPENGCLRINIRQNLTRPYPQSIVYVTQYNWTRVNKIGGANLINDRQVYIYEDGGASGQDTYFIAGDRQSVVSTYRQYCVTHAFSTDCNGANYYAIAGPQGVGHDLIGRPIGPRSQTRLTILFVATHRVPQPLRISPNSAPCGWPSTGRRATTWRPMT